MCCCDYCSSFCCYAAYCSECVSCAPCGNQYCGSCFTGCKFDFCGGGGSPVPGSGVGICGPLCNCDGSGNLAFAGTDESCNEIYMKPCGGLQYSDGSAATRCDITCNEGACKGTPCSPRTCGTTDQPPSSKNQSTKGSPQGGGSGSGSAGSSGGGGKSAGSAGGKGSGTQCISKLSQTMTRLGAAMTSLLAGGKTVPAATIIPGQAVVKNQPLTAITPNMFLLILIIVGGLLLVMAFGHKAEGA